jgi:hypothetical protein
MPRLYVSQPLVDSWLTAGRVRLDGDLLRLEAVPTPIQLHINPAVYFERVDGSDPDPYAVVGCVKSAEELGQMGAEHYENSVIVGDHAYTVRPGFLAIPVGADGTETLMDGPTWGRLVQALSQLPRTP